MTRTEKLNRSMPANLTHRITADEHDARFYSFDADDVWTADGWLVTSVYRRAVDHVRVVQIRRAFETESRVMPDDEMLFFTPASAKAKHAIAREPLETPQ